MTWKTFRYWRILYNIVQYHIELPNIVQYILILSNISQYCPIMPNRPNGYFSSLFTLLGTFKYCSMLFFIALYYQAIPNIVWYQLILFCGKLGNLPRNKEDLPQCTLAVASCYKFWHYSKILNSFSYIMAVSGISQRNRNTF